MFGDKFNQIEEIGMFAGNVEIYNEKLSDMS
jgi:hypothetical protein